MANLESVKDVRTLMAAAALAGVVLASVHFQNKTNNMAGRIDLMEQHLKAVIPQINPEMSRQMEQIMSAIRMLENRTMKTQEDMKSLGTGKDILPSAPVARTYQRLTERKNAPAPVINVASPAVAEGNLDEDIALMRA